MQIVKITGTAGAGKSTALNDLAELYNTQVIQGKDLMAAMPLLLTRTGAVAPNTFVDNVTQDMLPKIEQLTKLYDKQYRIYIVMEA